MCRAPRLVLLLFVCALSPITVGAQQPPPATPYVILTLTSAPDVVHPGDLLTYTATIRNTSSYDAPTVTLAWVLPGPVVAMTCGSPYSMFCVFPAIRAGATQTETRTIRVDGPVGAQLLASATVSSPYFVFNPQLNGATLSTTVTETPQADLAVAVEAARSTVQEGDVVMYTLLVTNGGTAFAASNVVVNFSLPFGLTFLSAPPECTGTSAIICTVGTVDSGSSTAFIVTARADLAGSITARASVATTSPEVNTGNNTGAWTIFVYPAPSPARRRAARH